MTGGRRYSSPLRWGLPLLVAFCLPGAVEAACPPAKPVHFAPGTSEATLTGGIPRGERDCYTLNARKGQTLTIGQSDTPDTNIVFQVYPPHWRIVGGGDDMTVSGPKALPGTGEGQDARQFTGALPASGDYLIVIGTSRGSGEYRLSVGVH